MQLFRKLSIGALSIGAAFLAAGCQSGGGTAVGSGPTTTPSGASVSCDKCQTVYSKSPVMTGGGPHSTTPNILVYRTVAEHECDECRNVVKDYFTYGKMKFPGETIHQCKLCGGTVKVCHESKL